LESATARVSPFEQLSPRKRDILRGIARGASNKEIARDLGIAETTVKIHVQHVLRKLEVSSRVQAAVVATAHGPLWRRARRRPLPAHCRSSMSAGRASVPWRRSRRGAGCDASVGRSAVPSALRCSRSWPGA
jgi:DNA-binding CsgD family transcriptional regulator